MARTVFLALVLTACASGTSAPISYGAGGGNAAAGSPVPPETRLEAEQPPPRRTAMVQAPADWAEGEGTPLSAYALRPEEAQPFDPANLPRTHRVGPNESLYDIATRYQVPILALIEQNGLQPPYALSPGRDLQLPPPRFHVVERGESFSAVARRYDVDVRSLALLNRMQPPYEVHEGDRIVLPAMAAASPAPVEPARATPIPPPAQRQTSRFSMPLNGDIVTRFGVQPGGGRVDGIEIAGREGDTIRAAADGDVVYAGSDLAAYGTLVLVRHADNYVTAYGHARRALVREGQRVRAGEPVAELGPRQDGRSRLLFQVRQGASAVDPSPLLGMAN